MGEVAASSAARGPGRAAQFKESSSDWSVSVGNRPPVPEPSQIWEDWPSKFTLAGLRCSGRAIDSCQKIGRRPKLFGVLDAACGNTVFPDQLARKRDEIERAVHWRFCWERMLLAMLEHLDLEGGFEPRRESRDGCWRASARPGPGEESPVATGDHGFHPVSG